MKAKLPLIARILLGLIFTVFGGMFFFTKPQFPEGTPQDMITFFQGLMASHYFLYLLKSTEVICGLLLLSGAFVPLALVVLAPIIVNIVCVHTFIAPSGFPLAAFIAILEIYLAFFSPKYSPIVKQLFRCPMREEMLAKKGSV